MKKIILGVFSLLFNGIFLASNAFSSVTCSLPSEHASPTLDLQGVPTISATPEMPIGTVLLQGRLTNNYRALSAECQKDANSTGTETLAIAIKTKVNGGNAINNNTFKTNIPGVGVQFWIAGGYILNDGSKVAVRYTNTNVGPGWAASYGYKNIDREMTFFLVKIADISPGVVDGSSFPSVNYTMHDDGSSVPVNGLPYSIIDFSFLGKVNITAPSCQTPGDFSVNLGSYDISYLNEHTTTPWKDIGLKLINCPAFSGFTTRQDSTWNMTSPGKTTLTINKLAEFQSNRIGVTLTPVYSIIDSTQGIFGIDTNVSNAAKGVAVQLAKGTSTSQTPWPLGTEVTQLLSMNDSPTEITIPMVARMVKENSVLSPGKVISRATYIINYK
jgi:major type 1 subunit fimbrin (pilin)